MLNVKKPITGTDMQSVKEYLGLGQLDSIWLFGASLQSWYGRDKDEPVGTSLALLARFYDLHPELCPLPKYPTYDEMYELMAPYYMQYYGKKLPHTKMGTLFGVGKWAGHNWSKNSETAPVIKRLFLAAKELIDEHGRNGFAEYLAIVETEAKARGFDDLEELSREGWQNRKLKEKIITKEKKLANSRR